MFTPKGGGVEFFFGPTTGATIPGAMHDGDAAANESMTVPAGKYLYLVGPEDAEVAVTAETIPT